MINLLADENGMVTVKLEDLVQFSVEQGMKAYRNCKQDHEKEIRKEKYNKKLHSTELLMKHYRDFKQHEKNAVTSLFSAIEMDDGIYDILGALQGYGKAPSVKKVESIENSVLKTKMIMTHIDSMLKVYRKNCEQTMVPEVMRRYRVVNAFYIMPERKNAEEIAEMECCDVATVYRDKKKALEDLAALIFGIDGIKLTKK